MEFRCFREFEHGIGFVFNRNLSKELIELLLTKRVFFNLASFAFLNTQNDSVQIWVTGLANGQGGGDDILLSNGPSPLARSSCARSALPTARDL